MAVTLDTPRFTKINETFECSACGKSVPLASSTCRDHCPFCLVSKHVDDLPGDRASSCLGSLIPTGYERHKKKGFMILYRCQKCSLVKKNKFLEQDSIQADSLEALLRLTPDPNEVQK
jgi:DNA-directed RNA polymerase subunit RPC12/RpoP